MSKSAEAEIDVQEKSEAAYARHVVLKAYAEFDGVTIEYRGGDMPRVNLLNEQGSAACFIVAMLGPKLDAIVERLDAIERHVDTIEGKVS
jgi:hypothetical protein